jgi:hypothetical protein
MLANSWVAAQLTASQEGLSSMSEWVSEWVSIGNNPRFEAQRRHRLSWMRVSICLPQSAPATREVVSQWFYSRMFRNPVNQLCIVSILKASLNNQPCNRPWRPTTLWDVEAPTFSPDNRLTDGGEVVSLTRRPPFTPPGRFLVLISVRGWIDPRAIVRLEGLDQLKNLITHLESNPRPSGL